MKVYIVLLGILIFTQQINAQIPEREVRKSERKEAKKERQEKKRKLTTDMVDKRTFVLKANYLSNSRGNRQIVNSTINFLQVDEDHAIIQIGSDTGIGYNGVGGITTDGRITSWEVVEKKNDSYYIAFDVITSISHYNIRMDVRSDGSARATLTGLRRGNLIYEGNLVPIETSRVFRGNSI